MTAPSFLLDDEFEAYFRDHPHENCGRIGAKAGGTLAMAGMTIGVFSAGRISRGDRFRSLSYDLSQAILVTQLYTWDSSTRSAASGRTDPNNLSFPSGHSSNAFTAATVVSLHYPKTALPVFGVAAYIGGSRMAANRHHFSDVVAGAGLGWSIARVVVRRNDRPPDPPKAGKTTWHAAPWRGPAGDGSGLALLVTF